MVDLWMKSLTQAFRHQNWDTVSSVIDEMKEYRDKAESELEAVQIAWQEVALAVEMLKARNETQVRVQEILRK